MQFRPDIQGLRGIAVLGVFLFHLGVQGISGGYVGVDIFFVISGFLITGIIAADMRAGRFTFAGFYNRRIKRILPAFQLVGMLTAAVGAFLLLPTSLHSLLGSLLASTLLGSNVFFWHETSGYFASDADELPLLHNWSLSVEEQFYLVWPLTLLLLLKFVRAERRIPLAIVITTVITFALAEWAAIYHTTASYFLLPTRAGEFLIGALLVFLPEGKRHANSAYVHAAAIVGLALVLGANLLLEPTARFPGFNAFWPCLGAALLIDSGRAGNNTLATAVLRFKPLVFIGTVSYSLYLWHWPPVAFLHYFDIDMDGWHKLALFVAILGVATLSWRFVEEPLRRLKWGFARSLVVLGLVPLALQASAFALHGSQGTVFKGLGEVTPSTAQCPEGLTGESYPDACRIGDPTAPPTFALWGDSFAGVLWTPLAEKAQREHASGYIFALSMCPSVTGVAWSSWHNPTFPATCRAYTDRILEFLVAHPEVETVVITSNYLWYLTGRNAIDEPLVAPVKKDETFADEVRITLERLAAAGKRVFVVMPHSYDKVPFTAALRRAYALGNTASLTMPKPSLKTGIDAVTAVVEEQAPRLGIERVYPDRVMCEAERCRVFDEDGDVYLSDGSHLTSKTARKVLEQLPPGWFRRR